MAIDADKLADTKGPKLNMVLHIFLAVGKTFIRILNELLVVLILADVVWTHEAYFSLGKRKIQILLADFQNQISPMRDSYGSCL